MLKTYAIMQPVLLFLLLAYHVNAQSGNHVFSGNESNNFGIINLGNPGNQTWSTDRFTPGYFSAIGTATYTGSSDLTNIDGYVKHYVQATNQGFTFPVGSGLDLRELITSGSIPNNSIFATAWILGDPSGNLDPTAPNSGAHNVSLFDTDLKSVSTIGQWDWQDISGTSNGITITVKIPDLTTYGDSSGLRLVGWNGTKWINLSGIIGASDNTENSILSGTMQAGITALGIGYSCVNPYLTISEAKCDIVTGEYTVDYISNGTVSVVGGTIVSPGKAKAILGTDMTFTATTGVGCSTSLTVTEPDSCPTNCVLPDLSIGSAVCDSVGATTYSVSYSTTTNAVITATGAGTIVNNTNRTVTANIGTDIVITATSGACIVSLGVVSPTNCSNPCDAPLISLGAPVCESNASPSYSLNYTTPLGVVITTDQPLASINPNTITGIPSGTTITVTATLNGCSSDTVLVVPPASCPICITPILNVGDAKCDIVTGEYTVDYISNGTVSVVGGTIVSPGKAKAILGTDMTFTATTFTGCSTSITVTEPDSCPTNCVLPDLSIGSAVCDSVGATTYSVSYSTTTNAVITATGAGTIVNNTNRTVTANIGTDIVITATSGACIVSSAVVSPTNCSNPCNAPLISLGAPVCESNASPSYSLNYTTPLGVVITTDQPLASINPNTITGIPSGTTITVTATLNGCSSDTVLVVPPASCPICITPILNVGGAKCDIVTGEYTVDYISNGTVSVVGGTIVSPGKAKAILGTDMTFTATTGVLAAVPP